MSELVTRNGSTASALYCTLDFPTGTQNVWSGPSIVQEDGVAWQPLMGIGRISALEETENTGGEAFQLQISANVADHDGDKYEDYVKALHLTARMRVEGHLVLIKWREWGRPPMMRTGPLKLLKSGLMSHFETNITAERATITLHCEPLMIKDRMPSHGRLTDSDQQARHPGDLILEEVASLSATDGGHVINWKAHT